MLYPKSSLSNGLTANNEVVRYKEKITDIKISIAIRSFVLLIVPINGAM